nr:alkali-sensitive linkage protein 1 [Quercus suber]
MRYPAIVAGAIFAQLTHGAVHRDEHGRVHVHNHAKKDIVTEIEYVTVWTNSPANYGATTSKSEAATTSSASVELSSSSSRSETSPAAYSSSAATAASSSSEPDSTGISKSNLTPNGNKAGLSGYIGIDAKGAFKSLAPYISWYSDYTAVTPDSDGVIGVGMLWGAEGSPCGEDVTSRLADFKSLVVDTTPKIMFGFYEPDCTCTMSSDMTVADAATQWDALIAPLASKGSVLGSPSMCKQKDEDFLTPFKAAISTPWDVTSIHINKPNIEGVKEDVEYYINTYGKPIWVSEFACVYDQDSFTPCSDQSVINDFIKDTVSYLEGNEHVVAYAPSNGEGLGTVWPLTDSNTGELTASGNAYLSALKSLNKSGSS